MRITEADWRRLEATSGPRGIARLRLYPDAPHDLFLAVRRPGNHRMLILQADASTAERALSHLPRTRGMDIQFIRTSEGLGELQIALIDTEFQEVFSPLVTDIAGTVRLAPDTATALQAALDRFEHWRHLLQSVADDGLHPEARRGLYGELVILRDHLLPSLAAVDAVNAWTGPTGANQDFQLPGAAIEVKATSAKHPDTLVISNERELDDRGAGVLLLAYLSLDERRGGEGQSLNSLVDALRHVLREPAARGHFDDLLINFGYLPQHRNLYDEPCYTVRHHQFWRVAGDFPRITESDLRAGVGDCSYRITTTGLDDFAVWPDELAGVIGGAHG